MARKTSVNRRSFLEQVVGGVVGSTLVVGTASATHGRLTRAGITDSDFGTRPNPAIEAENARIRAENRRVEEENRQIEAMRGQRDQLEAELRELGGPKPPQ